MSDTGKNIFTISEEELSFLRKKREQKENVKKPIEEILSNLQSYNELIGHRLKKIVPKPDDKWSI